MQLCFVKKILKNLKIMMKFFSFSPSRQENTFEIMWFLKCGQLHGSQSADYIGRGEQSAGHRLPIRYSSLGTTHIHTHTYRSTENREEREVG